MPIVLLKNEVLPPPPMVGVAIVVVLLIITLAITPMVTKKKKTRYVKNGKHLPTFIIWVLIRVLHTWVMIRVYIIKIRYS